MDHTEKHRRLKCLKSILKRLGERSRFWFVIVVTFGMMILTWALIDNNFSADSVAADDSACHLCTAQNRPDFQWRYQSVRLGEFFASWRIIFNRDSSREGNGTASVIAEQLIQIVPEESGMILNIILIAFIIFIFRILFIVPSSAIIVIFPVIISYASIAGIPALSLAFLVIMIVGGTNIFPIHAPTSYFAFQTGVLSKKDHYIIATFSTFVFVTMAITAAATYWLIWWYLERTGLVLFSKLLYISCRLFKIRSVNIPITKGLKKWLNFQDRSLNSILPHILSGLSVWVLTVEKYFSVQTWMGKWIFGRWTWMTGILIYLLKKARQCSLSRRIGRPICVGWVW